MSLYRLMDDPSVVLQTAPVEPLTFHRAPEELADLLTLFEVDSLIDSGCLPMRHIALLRNSLPVPRDEYANDDMPQAGYLRRHLADGHTLSLRSLQEFRPSLAKFYSDVVQETGHQVHMNAYLTPAGQQGLRYHYDPYVTLIVQLHGTKVWPIHPPVMPNATQEYGSFGVRGFGAEEWQQLANDKPPYEFTLNPGDVLWLPRGYIHAPHCVGEEPSLHITVALKERTLHWVAEQLADRLLTAAMADPVMRSAVVPKALADGPVDAVSDARKYLVASLLRLDMAEEISAVGAAAWRPN